MSVELHSPADAESPFALNVYNVSNGVMKAKPLHWDNIQRAKDSFLAQARQLIEAARAKLDWVHSLLTEGEVLEDPFRLRGTVSATNIFAHLIDHPFSLAATVNKEGLHPVAEEASDLDDVVSPPQGGSPLSAVSNEAGSDEEGKVEEDDEASTETEERKAGVEEEEEEAKARH